MQCDNIQEWILTDYIDGEIPDKQKIIIQEHMAQCSECREFEAHARKTAVDPFHRVEAPPVPAAAWEHIKSAIGQEKPAVHANAFPLFVGGIIRFLSASRAVWAMAASLAVLLFIALVPLRQGTEVSQDADSSTQIEYLASLIEDIDSDNTNDYTYGTAIEEYFL